MSRLALAIFAVLAIASLGERQPGSAAAAGATTQVAWSDAPQDGVATVPASGDLSVEARDAGNALNTSDNLTQVTLSLQPSSNLLGAGAAGLASASPGQVAALDHFAASALAPLVAEFDGQTGTIRRLTGAGGALGGPDSRPPSEIAADFLAAISGAAGFSESFASSLTQEKVDTTPSTGLTVVHYTQGANGLPVFDAHARVGIAADGRIVSYNANLFPVASAPAGPPLVDEGGAIAAATNEVGPPGAIPASGDNVALLTRLYTPVAVAVLYPSGGTMTTAWRVSIVQEFGSWLVIVDAYSGAVLRVFDFTADVGPEGDVFLENPNAGPQTTVPFVGDLPAPRDTWISNNFHTNCTTCTAGNNVTAVVAHEGVTNQVFGSSATLEFNFPWTDAWKLSADYTTDRFAVVTNLFYMNNVVHDWFYSLGFTESAGNFQSSNFGAAGYGDDPVYAYSQYGAASCDLSNTNGCRNRASFTFTYDGYISRMRMYLSDVSQQRSDTALDGDTIVHEYAHGLSTRIIGAASLSGIQSGAMGEGWGDYFAASRYDDPMVFEYSSNYLSGMRHHSYEGHPWTYSHLCQTTFPTGVSPRCEVHADGEIWAAALWDLRKSMVDQFGPASGAAMTDQLVVSGMKLTPATPDMLEGRDALLAADLAENAGANTCRIWQAFADRGMGLAASTDGDDDESATDSFALPPSCGGSSATLTCNEPLAQTVTAGVANWTGCTVSEPGLGYIVRASSSVPQALPPADSLAFNQTDKAYDATCNGALTADDALAVIRAIAGFGTGLLPAAPCTGNANGNTLDIADTLAIRKRIAGLE